MWRGYLPTLGPIKGGFWLLKIWGPPQEMAGVHRTRQGSVTYIEGSQHKQRVKQKDEQS